MTPERRRETWWTLFWIALFVGFLTWPACPDRHSLIIIQGCPPGHVAKGQCCALLEDGSRQWVQEGLGEGHEVADDRDLCDDRRE